jgi:DNA-binding transcriptional LysR family regulator
MTTQAIDFSDSDLNALSLRNLRAVAAIAREGSVSAAARRLGFSQAAVSAQLAAAEAALGTALFERHGRGVVATTAGRAVAARVSDVFAAIDTLRAEAAAAPVPTVTIGATEPTAHRRIIPFVKRTERAHPEVRIELKVSTPTEIRRLVEHGDLELAVTASQHGNSRSATFEALYEQELVLLVPEKHELAARRSADLLKLGGERLIVSEDACVYRRVVERALEDADIDVALRARFGSISTLPHGVAAGMGIAIVPRDLVDPPPPGTKALPIRRGLFLTIGLLLRRDASEPARRIAADLRAAFS